MHVKDAQHNGIDTMISCHSDGTGIDSIYDGNTFELGERLLSQTHYQSLFFL